RKISINAFLSQGPKFIAIDKLNSKQLKSSANSKKKHAGCYEIKSVRYVFFLRHLSFLCPYYIYFGFPFRFTKILKGGCSAGAILRFSIFLIIVDSIFIRIKWVRASTNRLRNSFTFFSIFTIRCTFRSAACELYIITIAKTVQKRMK